MANTKFSAVLTYRQEKNTQAYYQPGQPVRLDVDHAPSIRASTAWSAPPTTARMATMRARRRPTASSITNDTNYLQTYKGLELTMNKRLSNRWQLLVGYTLAKTEINNITLSTPSTNPSPNLLINATGNVTDTQRAGPPESVQGDRDVHPAVARRACSAAT